MITPLFEITQDDIFLYIMIKAPYSKVSEADIYIEDGSFRFHAKPYFLRLSFSASLTEDDRASCVYDVENGEYKLKIAKTDPGTHFEDLDMLTKLLTPAGERQVKKPLIEVIENDDNDGIGEDDEQFDWSYPQFLPNNEPTESLIGCGYGFANSKSGVFSKLQEDIHDVIQIRNIEQSSIENRSSERVEYENDKFNPEHYLADLFEETNIEELINLTPPWKTAKADGINFSEKDKFILKNFPNIEYLLDKVQTQSVYMGLVDILFSYAYNWRCTEGDYSVESPWNIRTVSTTLSWCATDSLIHKTLINSYRRCLIFPLYRNWKLTKACHKDVAKILSNGKKFILKCLLQIHDLFANSDPYYVLNDIYIRDYCIWIQKSGPDVIQSLSKAVKEVKIKKKEVELDLVELEKAAHLMLEEQESEQSEQSLSVKDSTDEISCKIEELKI
ncbi:protein SHQ1 homolog [Styela clava]